MGLWGNDAVEKLSPMLGMSTSRQGTNRPYYTTVFVRGGLRPAEGTSRHS